MPLDVATTRLLISALSKRESLRKITNAIRLVNGKGDTLDGLIIDQYDKHFSAQVFNKRWLSQSTNLRDFLVEHFKVDYFIVKDRSQSSSSKPEDFNSLELIKDNSKTVIKENNLCFEVDLNEGLNTGVFLDMRANRLKVAQACKNKRVLNCFAYTCSFGVYARRFEANDVVNVDISTKILDRGRRNYELNKFVISNGEFIKADVVSYLDRAVKKNNRFDVIIIDPPSFARVDNKVFNVEKALPMLMGNALKVLNEGGKLFVSTNYYGLSHNKLELMLRSSSQSRSFKKITRLGQDRDFMGSGLMKESYLTALWIEY